MDFVGQSTIAILVAAFVGFVIGGIWYGVLGNVWMKAASIDPADMVDENGKKKMPVVPFTQRGLCVMVPRLMDKVMHTVLRVSRTVCGGLRVSVGSDGLHRNGQL